MTDFSPPTSPEVVITCEVETTTSPSMQVINLVAFILSDLLVCGHDYFILIRIFCYRFCAGIDAGYADLYSCGVATKSA